MLEARTTLNAQGAEMSRPMERKAATAHLHELEFAVMSAAFGAHGGIMRSETFAECLRWTTPQPLSRLARWIVGRTIITLDRNGGMLIPMFQFELADLSLRPAFTLVFRELHDTFDDREVALWFATPNPWLGLCTPVSCLDGSEQKVAQAARADRFIARG